MTRTDGDQWDIVSSVGFTALMVSSFRALETTRTEPLIRDEYARAFVEASGEPRLTEALAAGTPSPSGTPPPSTWSTISPCVPSISTNSSRLQQVPASNR